MEILVGTYKEDEEKYRKTKIPAVRLSDDEYEKVLRCLVLACTDIVIIDRDKQIFYLANRISKPMTGWWWIGGRMGAGETKEEAAMRNFKRETGLNLSSDRLRLVAVFDYFWKDRQQVPQEVGCHMLAYTFVVELTAEELAAIGLEKSEYEASAGLTAFNREQLIKEKVFPAILDLYDLIFPS